MMFGRLGVSNAFSTLNTFDVWWVERDVTPSRVEECLYFFSVYARSPPCTPREQTKCSILYCNLRFFLSDLLLPPPPSK